MKSKYIFILLVFWSALSLAQDAWQQMNDFPLETRMRNAFATTDFGYAFVWNTNGMDDLYRYNPIADTWTQMQTPAVTTHNYATFSYNNEGYIFAADESGNGLASIYRYDEQNDSWLLVTTRDFGGFSFYGFDGSAVGLNDKFYVITPALDDFQVYNIINDTWEVLEGYPYSGPYETQLFTVDNKVFALFYQNMDGVSDHPYLYEYNIENDIWISRPDFPGNMLWPYPTGVFVIDDFIYAGIAKSDERFYRYDPSNNSWQQITNIDSETGLGTSFALSGYGYVVAGELNLNPAGSEVELIDDVWRLDPELLALSTLDYHESTISLVVNREASSIYVLGVDSSFGYSIYDVRGSLLLEGVSNSQAIMLPEISKGVYLFKIKYDEKIETIRFLKL